MQRSIIDCYNVTLQTIQNTFKTFFVLVTLVFRDLIAC